MVIRVLLADDHEVVRDGLRSLLARRSDLEVIGEAGDGREAVALAERLTPDVVVMDVSMPVLNGTDATKQIVREAPAVKVLALSMHPAGRIVAEMLCAGASGYVVKTCTSDELVQGIRAVHAGKAYLSPEVAAVVVDDYVKHAGQDDAPAPAALSDREREVLQMVTEGRTTKEIASELHVATKTVETHRHSITKKLGIHSIAELTKYAVREGLTPLES